MEPSKRGQSEPGGNLKRAYLLQAGGAAVTVGFVLAAWVHFVWSTPRDVSVAGGEFSAEPVLLTQLLSFLLFYFAWILTPFAVLHLSTRLLRAYRGSVTTLLAASIFLDVGSVWMLFAAFLAPPEGGSLVFMFLPALQLIVLAPFLVVAWVRSWHDVALICENGHIVNYSSHNMPESNSECCEKCGAVAMNACRSCNKPIRGTWWGGSFSTYDKPPSYCSGCGEPYPWTRSAPEAAEELIRFNNARANRRKTTSRSR